MYLNKYNIIWGVYISDSKETIVQIQNRYNHTFQTLLILAKSKDLDYLKFFSY